jgi:3-ketoacyl-CoA synthase
MGGQEQHQGGAPQKSPDGPQPKETHWRLDVPLHHRLPNYVQSVNLKHVYRGYSLLINHALTLLILPWLLVTVAAELSRMSLADLHALWEHLRFNLVEVVLCSAVLVFAGTIYFMSRARGVYLVEFACYKPEDKLKLTRSYFVETTRRLGVCDEKGASFQEKLVYKTGLGDETYVPENLWLEKPKTGMAEARKEGEDVMYGCLDELFKKTGVNPKDVGILITTCSLFNPTPSLSAMIVNHYKMRGNIKTYSLGGMGCSAGVIGVDLAKDLLQVHANTIAVVVSMENITQNWYFGNDR